METKNFKGVNAIRRYETIDIAKAFAIILVVIGHFVSDYMPRGYEVAHEVIYLFHMPLFMFASGFLCRATWREMSYTTFVWRKFKRLMVPYFTVSLLITCIKLATSGLLPQENPVTPMTFAEILWSPSAGYFLWFLWALWWMMVIIPFFTTPRSRQLLLAASLILFFTSPALPTVFCIDKFAAMLVFFSGGTVVCDYMKRKNIRRFSLLWQIVSAAAFAAMAWAITDGLCDGLDRVSEAIITLTVNILGIATGMSAAYWWRSGVKGKLLAATYSVAGASYVIYLLHTTFEGFAKGLLYKVHWFDHDPRLLFAWAGAFMVIACGTAIPWWLATRVLNRWRPTAFLFGLRPKTCR